MASENSGASHRPPSWPEVPRQDVPTSWPEAPTSGTHRQDPQPSWPEPPRDDAPGGWPEPPGVPTAWPSAQPPAPSWPEAPGSRGGHPQPSWPEPPVKDPLPAWSEPPPSSTSSDAWSNLNSPAPWPRPADTPQPGDPLDGTMTMDRVSDQSQPAPVPDDADSSVLGTYGPGALDDHPRAKSSAASAAERTMMYGRADLTGAQPGPGGPGGADGYGGAGRYGNPGGTDASSHGGRGGPGGGDGYGGRGGADGYGRSGGAGGYGGQAQGGQSGLADLVRSGHPGGPEGNAAPGARAHGGAGVEAPAGPGGAGGRGGPHGPGGSGGPYGPGGPDGPYGPGGYGPGGPESGPGGRAGGPGGEPGRPGANLSRDPSDPDRPFVTAGQISGSRTPPPERQQELWDTVFGDNHQGMGEPESLDEPGKPLWIYALASSAAVALVIALLWAFISGPLAADDSGSTAAQATPSQEPSAAPKKTSTTIGRLPNYRGEASPVTGTVQDSQAGIQVPRLGGTWRLDERPTVKGTYGYDTRQYAMVGDDLAAQVMTGPLPEKLAGRYSSPDDLEPVIKAVVVDARKRLYADGNKVRKIAQQQLKVGDSTGRLIAYSLTSPTEKATIVAAAINTGGDVPAIVFMSVPAQGKSLLPDVNTVVKRLRVIQG